MTRIQYLLVKLSEECHEVGKRAIKAAIFGHDEVQPGQPHDNAQRVVLEFYDLLARFEDLHHEAVFRPRTFTVDATAREHIEANKAKVEAFLKFSAGRGLISDMPAIPVPHPEGREAKLLHLVRQWWEWQKGEQGLPSDALCDQTRAVLAISREEEDS